MINVQQVLPILHRSMPKATVPQLIGAINKFQKAMPQINTVQFLALIQKQLQKHEGSDVDEDGAMNELAGGR